MSFRPFQPFRGFGGGSAAFSPLSLSPLLWLDASDGSTLYDAVSGGGLVSHSGAIARWEDKSGHENNAMQSVISARPVRTTQGIYFDGTETFFSGPLSVTLTEGRLFFVAAMDYTGPADGGVFSSLAASDIENSNTGGMSWLTRRGSTTSLISRNWDNSVERVLSAPTSLAVLAVKNQDGVLGTYVNGAGSDSTRDAACNSTRYRVGLSRTFSAFRHMKMVVAEIVLTPPISDHDAARMTEFLLTKWGIVP